MAHRRRARTPPRPRFGDQGGAANSAAFAAYGNCLTPHGVKQTGRFGAPGGVAATAKETKALAACAALRPRSDRQQAPGSTTTAPTTTTTQ